MKRWLTVLLLLFFISAIWAMVAKSQSYAEPDEALLAIDDELLFLTSYKLDDVEIKLIDVNTGQEIEI